MNFTYKKVNNTELFNNISNESLLNVENCQNFIPLYTRFFKLNEKNFNNINLNNNAILKELTLKLNENVFNAILDKPDKDNNNVQIENKIFFKLCPLLDPYRFLAGRYDISDVNLFNLPNLDSTNIHPKIGNPNNSSYVDSFFSFLTSILLNKHNFVHGMDFYGSYLAIKNNYVVDIAEDAEMLSHIEFFYSNNKKLYKFLNSDYEALINEDSRRNKISLTINGDDNDIDLSLLDIEDVDDPITEIDDTHVINFDSLDAKEDLDMIYKTVGLKSSSNKSGKSGSSGTTCSSRSSITNDDDSISLSDAETSGSDNSDESGEDNIFVSIHKFPIQIIGLEKCENTLDHLLEDNNLSQEELTCIVLQVLMMLITYQKIFNLTHNDLHTNNIMYIKTEKTFLYYKINNKHYKIRTFGKIFKIIDFGRAIYRLNGMTICSDSFADGEDAATQYNCEPYYNPSKTRVEPNYSFDLCRLGCSIYDFITNNYDDLDDIKWSIHEVIMNWCNDDDGKNILYKNNDIERYPDFKLYKMIARKVHTHMPVNELNHKCFSKFVVSKKEIKRGSNIWNIDSLNELEQFSENIKNMEDAAELSKAIKPPKKLTEQQKQLNIIRNKVQDAQLASSQ